MPCLSNMKYKELHRGINSDFAVMHVSKWMIVILMFKAICFSYFRSQTKCIPTEIFIHGVFHLNEINSSDSISVVVSTIELQCFQFSKSDFGHNMCIEYNYLIELD